MFLRFLSFSLVLSLFTFQSFLAHATAQKQQFKFFRNRTMQSLMETQKIYQQYQRAQDAGGMEVLVKEAEKYVQALGANPETKDLFSKSHLTSTQKKLGLILTAWNQKNLNANAEDEFKRMFLDLKNSKTEKSVTLIPNPIIIPIWQRSTTAHFAKALATGSSEEFRRGNNLLDMMLWEIHNRPQGFIYNVEFVKEKAFVPCEDGTRPGSVYLFTNGLLTDVIGSVTLGGPYGHSALEVDCNSDTGERMVYSTSGKTDMMPLSEHIDGRNGVIYFPKEFQFACFDSTAMTDFAKNNTGIDYDASLAWGYNSKDEYVCTEAVVAALQAQGTQMQDYGNVITGNNIANDPNFVPIGVFNEGHIYDVPTKSFSQPGTVYVSTNQSTIDNKLFVNAAVEIGIDPNTGKRLVLTTSGTQVVTMNLDDYLESNSGKAYFPKDYQYSTLNPEPLDSYAESYVGNPSQFGSYNGNLFNPNAPVPQSSTQVVKNALNELGIDVDENGQIIGSPKDFMSNPNLVQVGIYENGVYAEYK